MRHQLTPAALVQATIGRCALEVRLVREVAMNSRLLAVLIVMVLIVGSAVVKKTSRAAITRGVHLFSQYGTT